MLKCSLAAAGRRAQATPVQKLFEAGRQYGEVPCRQSARRALAAQGYLARLNAAAFGESRHRQALAREEACPFGRTPSESGRRNSPSRLHHYLPVGGNLGPRAGAGKPTLPLIRARGPTRKKESGFRTGIPV